jgi:L-lysine exporter family protein LysE/ArgO
MIFWYSGCAFLFYYAIKALKNAFATSEQTATQTLQQHNKTQIILLALGFSLLNPHAIIDSLVIIGGGSSEYPDQEFIFLMGVVTSSLIWFSSLTFTARYFSDVLARTAVWKTIELTSGLLMSVIGLKLGLNGLNLILALFET